MSMNGYLVQISAELLKTLEGSPDLVPQVLREDGASPSDDVTDSMKRMVARRLKEMGAGAEVARKSETIVAETLAGLSPAELALLKQLEEKRRPKGKAKPPGGVYRRLALNKDWDAVSDLMDGAPELGPDLGYGPARYLTRTQVSEVARALDGLSMPGAIESAEKVRSFYREAADKGYAVVFYLE